VSRLLHDSHRWDETGEVAVCRDCKVEGYDDEPGAFAPCPKSREKKRPTGTVCGHKTESLDDPGHQHECGGGIHPEGMHFCWECERWFG
jgi:hypothetical protein